MARRWGCGGTRARHAVPLHFGGLHGGGDIIPTMRGWFALVLVGSLLAPVASGAPAQLKDRTEKAIELPANMKDEDEDVVQETTYVFNPIQAKREVKVGKFYSKKGNHRAAAARYLEATRWNPSFVEAYWRLGRSREKLAQHQEALDAYRKYLKLDPGGKRSKEVRVKITSLERVVAADIDKVPEAGVTAKVH